MRPGRSPLTMRLTDEGKNLLERLAANRGISQTAVVEQLVRDEAERKGITGEPRSKANSELEPVAA